MALSGTINGTTNNQYIVCKASWSAVQSIAGNYSDVTVTLSYSRTNTGYTTKGTLAGNVYINGTATSYSKYVQLSYNSNTVVCTATTRVYHNDDGTKSITISATGAISGTSLSSTSLSGSVTLNTIARATTPSMGNPTMGGTVVISLPRASGSFTHTLTYAFGSASGTIATGVGTSYTWTVPLSLASQVPNATSGAGTLTCKTYNGSTLIGTKTISFTAYVPASVVPTISAVSIAEATAGLAAQFGAYVQNKSTLAVAITAAGAQGSTIKSYSTTILGVKYTAASFTSQALTASGSVPIAVTVTDSRGRTATYSTVVVVLAYFAPRINNLSAYRIDTSGNADDEGNRIAVTMDFEIAEVGARNNRTFSLQYRQQNDSTFQTFSSGTASWVYSGTQKFTSSPELSTDYAYVIRLTISDYFGTATYDVQVSTAFTLMDFRSTGKGMAIGKVSEKDAFEVAIDAHFQGVDFKYIKYDPISSSGDLDDYWREGNYFCSTNAAAAALSNCPTDVAFLMRVHSAIGQDPISFIGTWQYVRQEIYDLHDRRYVRHGETGSTGVFTWSAWKLVGGNTGWTTTGKVSYIRVGELCHVNCYQDTGSDIAVGAVIDCGTLPAGFFSTTTSVHFMGHVSGYGHNHASGRIDKTTGKITLTVLAKCTQYDFSVCFPVV